MSPPTFLGLPIKCENPLCELSGESFKWSVPDCWPQNTRSFRKLWSSVKVNGSVSHNAFFANTPLTTTHWRFPFLWASHSGFSYSCWVHSSPHSKVCWNTMPIYPNLTTMGIRLSINSVLVIILPMSKQSKELHFSTLQSQFVLNASVWFILTEGIKCYLASTQPTAFQQL